MAKNFIEIGGHLHNMDMLVEAIPYGPQGTQGYYLAFCNGSFVKLSFDPERSHAGKRDSPERKQFEVNTALATAIRCYLSDRTIQVTPGPYRRDEGDY